MAFKRSKKSLKREDIGKIVSSVQEGKDEAFSELFNLCYNEIFKIAVSNVHDYDKACDITQETFIEIFNTIKSLREPEAFYSWVKKIVYHRCTGYFRSKEYKHERLADDSEEINSFFESIEEDRSEFIPEASLEAKELVTLIRAFIKELPEEQRDAVIMYYFNDAPISEIAEIQGVSADTVKSRLYYARKALKKLIEEYEKDNNTKLHGIPFIPLILNALEATDVELTMQSAVEIAEGITAATGTTTVVSTAAGGATVGLGIVSTLKSAPLAAKIIAGITFLAVVTTPLCIGFAQRFTSNASNPPDTSSSEMIESDQETERNETNYQLTVIMTTADNKPYVSGQWSSSDVTIYIETEDSDCRTLFRYSSDSVYSEYSEKVVITEDGVHTVEFKSEFSNGESEANTIEVKIDKTSPTIEYSINDKYAADSLALLEVSIVNSDTGVQTMNIQTLEEFLRLESESPYPRYGAPGLSSRNKALLAVLAKEWISSSSAYIDVSCVEERSGIKDITYTLNGSSYTEENADFTITSLPNGEYDIVISITDHAGNTAEHTIPIKKNDAPPETYVNCATPNGGTAATPQTVTVKSTYGDTWYVVGCTSVPSQAPSQNGVVFDGMTYTETPPNDPGTPYICESSSKLSITAYSLSGLAGNTVEYWLYINEGEEVSSTIITPPSTSNNQNVEYTFFVNPDGKTVTISGYIGNKTEVIIPKSINGYSVTAIVDDDNTFRSSNIKSITFPEGIVSIGDGMFFCNLSLTTVNIPSTVKEIGTDAFIGGLSLTSINVSERNTVYYDINGVLFEKDSNKLIVFPGNYPVTHYDIPDGINSIGDNSFMNCVNVKSITIPKSVRSIESCAFYSCYFDSIYKGTAEQWELVSIDSGNTCFSSGRICFTSADNKYLYEICEYDYDARFKGHLTDSTDVIVPETIDGHAVQVITEPLIGLENAESITISPNICLIHSDAFRECTKLKTVYFLGPWKEWNEIVIQEGNDSLLNAELICVLS